MPRSRFNLIAVVISLDGLIAFAAYLNSCISGKRAKLPLRGETGDHRFQQPVCASLLSKKETKKKEREREKKRKREKNVSPRCCRTTLLDVWVESKRGEVERCCPLPQLIIPYPGVVIMSTSWVCERSSIISFTSRRHCSRSWPAQFRKSLRNNKSAWWIPATVHARSALFFFFFFFFLSLPIVITPRRVRGSPSSSIVDHDESSSSSSSSSSYDTFHTFLEIGRN